MEQKIEEFWNWFIANEQKLFELNPVNAVMLVEKSSNRLKRVNRGLGSNFSSDLVNGKREFIISSFGDKELFPLVFHMIEKSPNLPNWKFVALKPRHPASESKGLSLNGENYEIKDIYFTYQTNGEGKIDIVLYIKKAKKLSPNLMEGMYHILDFMLGEYDVETKLAGIDFQPYAAATSPHSLHKLVELPEIVDKLTFH